MTTAGRSGTELGSPAPRSGTARAAEALAIDVVVVLFFALVGRHAHDESHDVVGVLSTAWPFLVGTVLGSLLARSWRSVRRPTATRTAVVVWLSTVAVGLALRMVAGSSDQWPFVIVATVVLGLLLGGWRLAARATHRARRRLDPRRRHSAG